MPADGKLKQEICLTDNRTTGHGESAKHGIGLNSASIHQKYQKKMSSSCQALASIWNFGVLAPYATNPRHPFFSSSQSRILSAIARRREVRAGWINFTLCHFGPVSERSGNPREKYEF
jgi:hypothetical protein